MNDWSRRVLVAVVVWCLLAAGGVVHAADDIQVGILIRDSLKSTLRTLQGARKVILRAHPEAVFHIFQVGEDASANLDIIETLDKISL